MPHALWRITGIHEGEDVERRRSWECTGIQIGTADRLTGRRIRDHVDGGEETVGR